MVHKHSQAARAARAARALARGYVCPRAGTADTWVSVPQWMVSSAKSVIQSMQIHGYRDTMM